MREAFTVLEPCALTDSVEENLAEIHEKIARAATEGRRDASEVNLICVCKAQPVAKVEAALASGERIFGENYVQEAQARWPDLRSRFDDVEVHMIGALQSNKAAEAVALFDVIQSVDRPKLATALAKEMRKQDRQPRLFIQVNLGEEPQKAGILPNDLDGFVKRCRDELDLKIEGLMAIPPAEDDVALHTALLRKLAKRHELTHVSIGMSGDFEKAIAFGATHVRVGTAIFGARNLTPKS